MRTVHAGPIVGLAAQLALLAGLAAAVGLGAAGWIAGTACAVIITVTLDRALVRRGLRTLGPADRITLLRATLVVGVTALVADPLGASASRATPVTTLLALTVAALVLDAVDGQVARRTGTVSPLGARFDMEIDALLILVLSVDVARSFGPWVLALGFARYGFVAAGLLLPWLRAPRPPRYWCKVVAATVGIVLAVAAADVVPRAVSLVALIGSLVLLTESFGRDVVGLWQRRPVPAGRTRVRAVAGGVVTFSAVLLVWFALVGPDRLDRLTPTAMLRIPLEGLVIVAIAVVVPVRMRRVLAWFVGLGLGLLTVLKLLDMGFFEAFDRPFDPVVDWSYFGSAEGLLADSIGRRAAIVTVTGAVLLVVAILVLTPLAVVRLTRIAHRHRTGSFRAVTALGVVWAVCAAFGVQFVAGAPVASTSAASLAYARVRQIDTSIRDEQRFARTTGGDPLRTVPAADLLNGLRGKDVVIAFVESYGRVAVQGSPFSAGVDSVLDAGTRTLSAAGFSTRSAFLTSPTFGGISWLAHSTLQSGLWIDNQLRYNDVTHSDRATLSSTFKRAGWRTVDQDPANFQTWAEGTSFYHYDKIYDSHNVGYRGPQFSYALMPDQYVLSAFQRYELAKPHHRPVMAEIDLVSSHTPWTPLPRMVPWRDVGDGSIYDSMPGLDPSPATLWQNSRAVQAAYGRSIEYTLSALISFVRTYHDDNLVLVVLGDHQPATIVSGPGAGHDVPITIVAHDPSVLARISSWGWQPGMRPRPDAPVWPMDSFRNRFLAAYGSQRSSASLLLEPQAPHH